MGFNQQNGGFEGFYHLVMTNIAMENPVNKWRFLAGGFSMAMLEITRG